MRRLTVLAVVLVTLLLSACGGHAELTGRAGDIAFAQAMIPHHEQALEMAEIALGGDASAPVLRLARAIQRTQEPEILLMRQWLDEWGAEELPHAGTAGETAAADDHGDDHAMPGMATGEQLLALADASGPDFDRQWLDLMIAHHEGAIEMAEQVLATSDDLEVQALAAEVVAAQQAEIEEMRALADR